MRPWFRIALSCISLLGLGLAPVGAALAQVKVTAANPSSAYQGTCSLYVVVSGSGFNPSAKVQYLVSGTGNPGGITVRNVRFNSSNELVTAIDVADTADLASFDIVVTLANSGGAWRATWALATGIGCQSAAGSLPDPVVHQGARMAFDPVAGVQVFFGGTSSSPLTAHGNTVECL